MKMRAIPSPSATGRLPVADLARLAETRRDLLSGGRLPSDRFSLRHGICSFGTPGVFFNPKEKNEFE